MRGGKFIGYEIISEATRRDKNRTEDKPFNFEKLSPEIRDPCDQMAQRILQTEIYGLGIDFLRDYLKKSRIPETDILRCARMHLDPENLVIAIVGRAEAFHRDFERWSVEI
jgi:hypothetical protein